MRLVAGLPLVLIAACGAPHPIDADQAIVRARTELFKRQAHSYPQERQSRIRCKATSDGELWKVDCSDLDAATGGDANISVEKATGQVGDIWLGQ